MAEIWKIIPNFSNYEVSNMGNVRNKKKKNLLSLVNSDDGYVYVTMYQDKYYRRSVHTLVASAFIWNPHKKQTVNHVNGNRADNRVCNLEYATYSEQIKHRNILFGKKSQIKGSSIWKCDFTSGEKIERFESIQDALRSVGEANIKDTARITNHMEDAYGFKWIFDNDDMDDEQWKEIPASYINGNTGYNLSTMGRVKTPAGKILNGYTEKRGYKSYHIKDKLYMLNKLMSLVYFNTSTDSKIVLNHKDGNKSNYNINNLEVISQSENISHAYQNNLLEKKNKTPVYQLDSNGNVVKVHDSLTAAEKSTGINRGTFHQVINGRFNYFYRGFYWMKDQNDFNKNIVRSNI